MRADNLSAIRLALLTAIAACVAMIAVKVLLYRPLLAQPGGPAFVLATIGLLILYAICILWATRRDGWRRTSLLVATPLGLAGGAIQLVHLTQEELWDLGRVGNAVSGFGLLLCTFLLWGLAGYRTARITGAVQSSAMAGLWGAIVTVSMLVSFGFALEFFAMMPKPEYVATWGEFKRSGWTDIRAFTTANTLDSALSHLIVGPVVGAIVGAIAGCFTVIRSGRTDPSTIR